MTKWHESEQDVQRRAAAAAQLRDDMRVLVKDWPTRKDEPRRRLGSWHLHRRGGLVAVAQYKFRKYVPKLASHTWKLDCRKVDALRRYAEQQGVPALLFIEAAASEDCRGVRLTYQYLVGTVLRDGYRRSVMTLNNPRDEGDLNDPVYEIPDREFSSPHLLADKLWPNTAPHFRSQIDANIARYNQANGIEV